MKGFIKIACFVLTLVFALSLLASCGNSEIEDAKNDLESALNDIQSALDTRSIGADTETVSGGETTEWGDFSVLVPEGYEFRGGDVFDDQDTSCFSVKKSDFSYFDFQAYDSEEKAEGKVNQNKTMYTSGQEDVEIKIGENTWRGFTYDSIGSPAFEVYTVIGDTAVKVSSSGFAIDGEVAEAVLGSLTVK